MEKKELLFQDWKECVENIRFYRNEINKMSIWEFGLFPTGMGIAIKFFLDKNIFLSGLVLLGLFLILGFIDNLTHINARYSIIHINLAKEIEAKLGTRLITAVGLKYNERLAKDKKKFFRKFNIFHINVIRHLKHIALLTGLILIITTLFL